MVSLEYRLGLLACVVATGLGCSDEPSALVQPPSSIRLTVDQFAPQSWKAPEQLNAFVLKSLNGDVVLGIAFTDAESLPTLRKRSQGPVIEEEFASAHDFLAVFRFPWTSLGKENPQLVLDTFVAGRGLGGIYQGSRGTFRLDDWVEGELLKGNVTIPLGTVVSRESNYPPRDWELALADNGQIYLEFDGPYNEWKGQTDTCYSPFQNIESATSALGFGCSCDPAVNTQAPTVTAKYDDDSDLGYVFFMACDSELRQWTWGNASPSGS